MARIGKVVISGEFYRRNLKTGAAELMLMQKDMTVLDVKNNVYEDQVIFIAIHPVFDEIEQGQMMPEYECTATEFQPIEAENPEYIYSFKRID